MFHPPPQTNKCQLKMWRCNTVLCLMCVWGEGEGEAKHIHWRFRHSHHKAKVCLMYSVTGFQYVLFNDALNTFYLRLYGVRHMVKYHTDSERGNPLPPHGLLFPINSKGFICTIPQTELHIPRPLLHQSGSSGEIAQWVHPFKDRSDDPSHHERTLLPRSYFLLSGCQMKVK